MSQSKDVTKLLKELRREGWRIETGGKHLKAYHPKGGFVSMSVSPSCMFAVRHIMADVNKLKKSHNETSTKHLHISAKKKANG